MKDHCDALDLSEDDVINAMRSMQGYVDITPGDFGKFIQSLTIWH